MEQTARAPEAVSASEAAGANAAGASPWLWWARLAPLVISAPFGNYIQPAGATPTLGTFTALRRRGRLWRIIRTVRYHHGMRAWTNKIGLRNPGIDWLANEVNAGKKRVDAALVSIHGFDDDQWRTLLERAAALRPLGIELNMSCPNVGHVNWPADLFERAARVHAGGVGIVVKLPPVNFETMVDQALSTGLRAFHCCNTLPVPAGGLSGKPLKPVALQCIEAITRLARERGTEPLIIGGGGITTPADIDDYARLGATRFAIGTKAFDPRLLISDAPIRGLIQHAAHITATHSDRAMKSRNE